MTPSQVQGARPSLGEGRSLRRSSWDCLWGPRRTVGEALPRLQRVPWETVSGREDRDDTHGVLALDRAPGREEPGKDPPPGLGLTLPSPCCVTLDKLFHLSESQKFVCRTRKITLVSGGCCEGWRQSV